MEVAEVGEAGELVDAVWVAAVSVVAWTSAGDGRGGHVAWVGLFGFFVMKADDVEEARVVGVDGD